MAALGRQEGNACTASRCAGGLARGREGRRRACAACVPIWAGPAGRARCHRAVSQEPCSPAAAPRPRMLVMLAPPRTAGGWAQRGGREPAGFRLPREGLTPSRREKADGHGKSGSRTPYPGSGVPLSLRSPLAPARLPGRPCCPCHSPLVLPCLCIAPAPARAWLPPWLIKWPLEFP